MEIPEEAAAEEISDTELGLLPQPQPEEEEVDDCGFQVALEQLRHAIGRSGEGWKDFGLFLLYWFLFLGLRTCL